MAQAPFAKHLLAVSVLVGAEWTAWQPGGTVPAARGIYVAVYELADVRSLTIGALGEVVLEARTYPRVRAERIGPAERLEGMYGTVSAGVELLTRAFLVKQVAPGVVRTDEPARTSASADAAKQYDGHASASDLPAVIPADRHFHWNWRGGRDDSQAARSGDAGRYPWPHPE